jgi:diacylglycerol kinase family enzyme
MSPITAIINGNAGALNGPDSRSRLTGLLQDAFPGIRLEFCEQGSDIDRLAREALSSGSDMVIAGGGDGTINAVASHLVHSGRTLGVLPLGTLNHFARDLGIPLELEPALAVIASGRVLEVDVGTVNRHVFLNTSGLGLYPAIVQQREAQQNHGWSKWPAAIWATIKALARYRRLHILVSTGEKHIARKTPIVFVGNNEYELDGIRVPSRSSLTGGRLCVYIPHPTGRVKLLWFSLRALVGRPRTGEDFDAMLVRECRITSRHHLLRISIDGEVVRLAPPLDFEIQPGALRVMTPHPEPDAGEA